MTTFIIVFEIQGVTHRVPTAPSFLYALKAGKKHLKEEIPPHASPLG
jgi:hypothetical protein